MDKVAAQGHLLAGIANMDQFRSRVVHLAVFQQGTDRIIEHHALTEGMNFQVFKNNIIPRYVNTVVAVDRSTVNLRRICRV